MSTANFNIIASDLTKLTKAMEVPSEGNNCLSYNLHIRTKGIDEFDRINSYFVDRWLTDFNPSEISESYISSFYDNSQNHNIARVFGIRWDQDSETIYPDCFEYRVNSDNIFYYFSIFEDSSTFGKIYKKCPKCYTLKEIQDILNN